MRQCAERVSSSFTRNSNPEHVGSISQVINRTIWTRNVSFLRCLLYLLPIAIAFSFPLFSQAQSISVGGGSLSFTESTSTESCTPARGGTASITVYTYTNFAFVDSSGTRTPFNAETYEAYTGAVQCNVAQGPNPLALKLPVGATINFTMNGRGNYNATASSLVDPLYKVTSVLYATPGNVSSDSYTSTATSGTTTMVGHSFQAGDTVTFSYGWALASVGFTFGASQTTGNSNAFTESFSGASSLSNASATSGPNTISHNQDELIIWLNPEVELTGTSSTIGYTLHTQYQNGTAEQPDFVEVNASVMQPSNGVTNVPLAILQKQYDPATKLYDLPGLAAVCANQAQYVNNCPSGGQCGCVPNDFTGILASDPLLNTTTATNPLTVDTSGSTVCSSPTSSSSCRYVPVPSSSGSTVPMTTLLSGPNCNGCNRPTNGYTQTDTTATTQTLSESNSTSVSFVSRFGGGTGPSVSLGASWVWTDMESVGASNGTANSIGYSLSSSTPSCYQDVSIYEDTVFHTFVTQQAPGNNTCP